MTTEPEASAPAVSVPQPAFHVTSDDDWRTLADQLDPAAAAARRMSERPNVDHLPSGTLKGAPLFGVGEKIVVERRSRFVPGNPWLDTRVLNVVAFESGTVVRCYDPDKCNVAFVGTDDPWTRVFLTHGSRNPLGAPTLTHEMSGSSTMVSPSQGPANSPPSPSGQTTATAAASDVLVFVKRGRGRPKGSKNKPKADRR